MSFPKIIAILAPKATTGNEVNGAKVKASKIPVIIADKFCVDSESFKNTLENIFSVHTADKTDTTITKSALIP